MKYEPVIGLEIHAELSTQTKIFCGCRNRFGAPENTLCCPVCTGMPGALPVLNEQAVDKCIQVGLALHCTVSEESRLDRKHYFYPDLPKAYQISQYDQPLCRDGYLDLEWDGTVRRIRIERIHIEEDAGKLDHESACSTRIDYNRSGVPLIEIVTRPDLRSPEEAKAFFAALRNLLLCLDASDCKMEEGSLRCDVNVSLRPFGSPGYGKRTEMKNVHSFRAAYRAMKYEIARQAAVLEAGGEILSETRKWDDAAGKSYLLRTKETAEDYRFLPDPDLVPILIPDTRREALRASLPELPLARKARYQKTYALSASAAAFLSDSKPMGDYFDACVTEGGDPKAVCHALMGDVTKLLHADDLEEIPFPPTYLVRLLALLADGSISGPAGKQVLRLMFEAPRDPMELVKEKGLLIIEDDASLRALLADVLRDNPRPAADYRMGKKAALGYLVGQVMRRSDGKADPKRVQALLSGLLAPDSNEPPTA